MKTQICPKCGEELSAAAVMCWACYTPLSDATLETDGLRPEPSPATEKSAGDKVKRWLSDGAPYAAVATSIASGWLPRRWRLPVLGASLSALLGPMLFDELKNRLAKKQTEAALKNEGERAPSARIAESILRHASEERASETRIVENGQSLKVYFRIEGQWHEQMSIPRYAWKPIRQQLLRWARRGEFDSRMTAYESGGRDSLKLIDFRAQLTTNAQYESLALRFESAPLEDATLKAATGNQWFEEALDLKCSQCGEENAPDAVWCWNCGADLKQQTVSEKKKHLIFPALLLTGFAILSSSGWWTKRARWPVVGAGVSIMAPLFAYFAWETRRGDRERKRIENDKFRLITHEYEASSARLVNDILVRAIQNKIPAIQLRENGNVVVSYELDGQWQQAKILPAYVWAALRTDLLNRARGKVTCQGREYRFQSELSAEREGETLVLRFEGEKKAFPAPDEELICARCGEASAPSAVMCRSCYAPVGNQIVK